LGRRQYPYASVTLVPSHGYRVAADRFRRAFEESDAVRQITLGYLASQMSELTAVAACNRVHSHRQRLARWLLITTDKAQQPWLPVTHDALAQMVGGPRHAVTVALNELRTKGAISCLRGRIDVLKRPVLIREACECYSNPPHFSVK